MNMVPDKNSLLSKIRSRGYWQVVIRPTRFEEKRLEIPQLFSLVEKHSVHLRGWDYPHVDHRTQPRVDLEWVGQEFEWEHYLEVWRMYQSGQFAHFFGVREDWRDQSRLWPAPHGWRHGSELYAISTLFEYTEILEFAARLALDIDGDDIFHIAITLNGLQGRRLADDRKFVLGLQQYTTDIDKFPYRIEKPRTAIVATARELALQPALELFQHFGWDPSLDLLREEQANLFRSRLG